MPTTNELMLFSIGLGVVAFFICLFAAVFSNTTDKEQKWMRNSVLAIIFLMVVCMGWALYGLVSGILIGGY